MDRGEREKGDKREKRESEREGREKKEVRIIEGEERNEKGRIIERGSGAGATEQGGVVGVFSLPPSLPACLPGSLVQFQGDDLGEG